MIKVKIQGTVCILSDGHWSSQDHVLADELNTIQDSLERARPKDAGDLWAADAMIGRLGGSIITWEGPLERD